MVYTDVLGFKYLPLSIENVMNAVK